MHQSTINPQKTHVSFKRNIPCVLIIPRTPAESREKPRNNMLTAIPRTPAESKKKSPKRVCGRGCFDSVGVRGWTQQQF